MAANLSRPSRTAIKTWRIRCDWPMFDLVEDAASKMRSADIDSLRGRLTSATCNFSQHLATQRGACLAQIWVPDSQSNGPVTLHTQVGACRNPASDRKPRKLCMLFTRFSLHSVTIRPHFPRLHGICVASSAQRMLAYRGIPRQCCIVCHCCTCTPEVLCLLLAEHYCLWHAVIPDRTLSR